MHTVINVPKVNQLVNSRVWDPACLTPSCICALSHRTVLPMWCLLNARQLDTWVRQFLLSSSVPADGWFYTVCMPPTSSLPNILQILPGMELYLSVGDFSQLPSGALYLVGI